MLFLLGTLDHPRAYRVARVCLQQRCGRVAVDRGTENVGRIRRIHVGRDVANGERLAPVVDPHDSRVVVGIFFWGCRRSDRLFAGYRRIGAGRAGAGPIQTDEVLDGQSELSEIVGWAGADYVDTSADGVGIADVAADFTVGRVVDRLEVLSALGIADVHVCRFHHHRSEEATVLILSREVMVVGEDRSKVVVDIPSFAYRLAHRAHTAIGVAAPLWVEVVR